MMRAATERQQYRGYVAATNGRCPPPAASAYREQVRGTIAHLRLLREYRAKVEAAVAAGHQFGQYPVAYTTDPTWLVDMAINRRAGWPDDRSGSRGSAMPVNGKFPKRAEGDGGTSLRHLANCLGGWGARVRVHERDLNIFPRHVRERLLKIYPNRFTLEGED